MSATQRPDDMRGRWIVLARPQTWWQDLLRPVWGEDMAFCSTAYGVSFRRILSSFWPMTVRRTPGAGVVRLLVASHVFAPPLCSHCCALYMRRVKEMSRDAASSRNGCRRGDALRDTELRRPSLGCRRFDWLPGGDLCTAELRRGCAARERLCCLLRPDTRGRRAGVRHDSRLEPAELRAS